VGKAREPTGKQLEATLLAHFAHGDLKRAREVVSELLSSKRATVKRWAARFILEHERDLYKHENPAKQLHEMKHNFPDKVELVIVKGGKGPE
jgi:hypothetical protein